MAALPPNPKQFPTQAFFHSHLKAARFVTLEDKGEFVVLLNTDNTAQALDIAKFHAFKLATTMVQKELISSQGLKVDNELDLKESRANFQRIEQVALQILELMKSHMAFPKQGEPINPKNFHQWLQANFKLVDDMDLAFSGKKPTLLIAKESQFNLTKALKERFFMFSFAPGVHPHGPYLHEAHLVEMSESITIQQYLEKELSALYEKRPTPWYNFINKESSKLSYETDNHKQMSVFKIKDIADVTFEEFAKFRAYQLALQMAGISQARTSSSEASQWGLARPISFATDANILLSKEEQQKVRRYAAVIETLIVENQGLKTLQGSKGEQFRALERLIQVERVTDAGNRSLYVYTQPNSYPKQLMDDTNDCQQNPDSFIEKGTFTEENLEKLYTKIFLKPRAQMRALLQSSEAIEASSSSNNTSMKPATHAFLQSPIFDMNALNMVGGLLGTESGMKVLNDIEQSAQNGTVNEEEVENASPGTPSTP